MRQTYIIWCCNQSLDFFLLGKLVPRPFTLFILQAIKAWLRGYVFVACVASFPGFYRLQYEWEMSLGTRLCNMYVQTNLTLLFLNSSCAQVVGAKRSAFLVETFGTHYSCALLLYCSCDCGENRGHKRV